jgi:hypothetical protein
LPVALHAAALEPRIKAVTLEESLISWSDVVTTPITSNQLTNVVPGALKVYDLPDLATALAPRPLTIRRAVDATGKAVTQEAMEQTYAAARRVYERAGAANSLVLQAGS